MALVFLPLSGAELRDWATGGSLAGQRRGYAVTPAMAEAFGVDDPEDAEYAALCIASIAGLLAHGERIVAVAEAAFTATPDDFGEVSVSTPAWAAVDSLFGEDTDAAPARATGAAMAGLPLARAWDEPQVQALLADTDLLWYGPAEWALLAP
ncbi:MAG: hypothetical protein AAGC63_12000 [Propionicimonas sp.]|nr:hypothetical protein [Propionicimonas sp.]